MYFNKLTAIQLVEQTLSNKQIILELDSLERINMNSVKGLLKIFNISSEEDKQKAEILVSSIYEQLKARIHQKKNEKTLEPILKQPNKEYKDLPLIVKFYAQHINEKTLELDATKLEDVLDIYIAYITNPKLYNNNNNKITKFDNFEEFQKVVASTTKVDKPDIDYTGDPSSIIARISNEIKPEFDNGKIAIFFSSTKKHGVLLGQGCKSGLCTARTDSSNMYYNYRYGKNGSIYYIYFYNPPKYAPMGFIDISLYPNELTINYVKPNIDKKTTKEKIKQIVPELAEKDEKGNVIFNKYIVPKPPTEEEKTHYRRVTKMKSVLELTNPEDISMYLEDGKEIENKEWEKIDPKLLDFILKKYVEVGEYDIPESFKTHPIWKRYQERLKTRLNIKIENDDFDEITLHEFEVAEDENIKSEILINNPSLQIINAPEKTQIKILSRFPAAIIHLLNKGIKPSEQVQLAAVNDEDGQAMGPILDSGIKPSEQVQLAAVNKHGYVLSQLIDNGIKPSEEVQLAAVRNNSKVIRFIKNPSEQVQLAAVNKVGDAIDYILNNGIIPSEEVQLVAVNHMGYNIGFITKKGITPSEKVQLTAVRRDGNAIQYIDNPSEQVQMEAVKENGYAIAYIKNPSEELQLAAVRRNGNTIQYIDNPSEEVQMEAVKQNGSSIAYIKNPSKKNQLFASKQLGISIEELLKKFKIKQSTKESYNKPLSFMQLVENTLRK